MTNLVVVYSYPQTLFSRIWHATCLWHTWQLRTTYHSSTTYHTSTVRQSSGPTKIQSTPMPALVMRQSCMPRRVTDSVSASLSASTLTYIPSSGSFEKSNPVAQQKVSAVKSNTHRQHLGNITAPIINENVVAATAVAIKPKVTMVFILESGLYLYLNPAGTHTQYQ